MIQVIIPAYNCLDTLGRALASLAAQTDPDFEVILVDDCSTENIKEAVDAFVSMLTIHYIRNEKNMGCGMSRQVGIDRATAPFITFLDADDVFMPYTTETFNAVVAAHPETEYLHTHFYQQAVVDGAPVLCLYKDNFTACHGKLYNVKKLRELGIRNSPLVRWADDSFFNSMCSELMTMSIIPIPTMVWCNNRNSIMRRDDPVRDALSREDFLSAMMLSSEFVMRKKGRVDHLSGTLERFAKTSPLSAEDMARFSKFVKAKE